MERYHPLTRYANLATWDLQARVVAVSEEVERSIRQHTKSTIPVDVVLNGIDIRRFDRSIVEGKKLRRDLGIPERAQVVGTVAVFRRQKRLDVWLGAARHLLNRNPDLHFLIVGDGPLREDLLALRDSLDLGNVVHFPGLEEDVRPYLAMMDVFMSSSDFEGLPLALLEAMSMQCVVVATRVGGVPEIIENGVNGFLIEPGRPLALADLTSEVLANVHNLASLKSSARKAVKENFGIARMVRHLEEIYLATSVNAS
jgi:glycosyltransferase involved in cell wall biosynthesis